MRHGGDRAVRVWSSDARQEERFRRRLHDPTRRRVVESDDRRRARLNMIADLLSTVPYETVDPPVIELPPRPPATGYQRPPRNLRTYVPDHASQLRN